MRMLNRLGGRYVVVLDRINKALYLNRELRYWREREAAVVGCANQGYRRETGALGLEPGLIPQGRDDSSEPGEKVIADVDRRGFLLSRVGNIPCATLVAPNQFVARTRCSLQLVDLNGWLGIKKCYRGNYWSFVNELRALHLLGLSKANVPSIMAVDFGKPGLTLSYICGTVLSHYLAGHGAALPNRKICENPQYKRPSKAERLRIVEGEKDVYQKVVDSGCVDAIWGQVRIIHSTGIVWNDIKYGNVILERSSGRPFLIDFENARHRMYLGKYLFERLCARDFSETARYFGERRHDPGQ